MGRYWLQVRNKYLQNERNLCGIFTLNVSLSVALELVAMVKFMRDEDSIKSVHMLQITIEIALASF